MQNEKAVKAEVKKILNEYKDRKCWWFMPPANGYGRSGIPDFVGCLNGFMFAIETKSGTNSLTNNQVKEIGDITQARGKCWIVREASLDTFRVEFAAWAALCS